MSDKTPKAPKTAREILSEMYPSGEFERMLELAATPIDFEQLVADGVLKKRSGGWWEVLDMNRLPEHATRKVQGMKHNTKTKTSCFKFCKHNAKLLEQFRRSCAARVSGDAAGKAV